MPIRSLMAWSFAPQSHAEDFDVAGRSLGEALDDLDGRGLAGAVGAEQAETLAGLDRQVQAAHGFDGRPAVDNA